MGDTEGQSGAATCGPELLDRLPVLAVFGRIDEPPVTIRLPGNIESIPHPRAAMPTEFASELVKAGFPPTKSCVTTVSACFGNDLPETAG